MTDRSARDTDIRVDTRFISELRLTEQEGRFFFALLSYLAGTQRVRDVGERLCQTVKDVIGVDAAVCYLVDGDDATQAYRLDPTGLVWFPESFSLVEHRLHRLRYGEVQRRRPLDRPITYVAAPLITEGIVRGMLVVFSRDAKGLSREQDIGVVQKIALLGSLAMANARLVERLEDESLTDPLTGLPNRRALRSKLADAMRIARRYKRPLSVIMIDIDHFKWVNDDHSHEVGDETLVTVARLLQSAVRDTDTVVRMGGEEMLILLPETPPDSDGEKGAVHLARRLRALIATTPFPSLTSPRFNGRLTVSLGVAGFDGGSEDTVDGEALIARADAALYTSKQGGRDMFTLWRPDLRGAARGH